NVPVVLDHVEQINLRIGAVELRIELYHLLAADNVPIQVIDLPGQGIQAPDGAPLLIIACPPHHLRLYAPGGSDRGPALIAKFIQEQRHDRFRVAGRVTQTALQPSDLAAVGGIGAEQLRARRAQRQATGLQYPPDSAQCVPSQPVHRHANRAQCPAARLRPTLAHCHFLPRRLAWPCTQGFKQFLFHGGALLEATSDGPHRVGGPGAPPVLRSHITVTTHRRCPGRAASVTPGSPPHVALGPPQSLTRLRSVLVRRAGHHDPDTPLTPAAAWSLALEFVVLPSGDSPCMPDV